MTENSRIEFKSKLTDELEKEVVAFLNSEGGVIYIGRDEEKAYKLNNIDEIQLKIKDRLKHNISPSILGLFDIVVEEFKGEKVIKINIASGSEKPYYIKKRGMSEKGCFIRVAQ
ncbi:ATP-binding protein [Caminibacter pacificus]|uniref:ATP-binding protein n=1 Tax=Caminibacter pacificus TaxID=1424653 RepID=A0AAJ4RCX4_9BACT|nr:ATP-binding protein [Caminibacter pacificus]QCI27745.1 ATP-binding protein [Caminibacter pacificus]ROR40081.1 putative DNA-binding protein [Caminibacter pacificus]